MLTSETEAETSSSSSLHVRPPAPPGPPLITSHQLKSGHSVRRYQVNHSERGRENLLRLFPDQSKPIPAFSFGLGSENEVGLSSQWSSPVIVSSQWTTEECQLVLLQGFFTVLDKCRWMDGVDGELLLHRGEVALHLLPTGNGFSSNCPKRTSFPHPQCFSVKQWIVDMVAATSCLLHPDLYAESLTSLNKSESEFLNVPQSHLCSERMGQFFFLHFPQPYSTKSLQTHVCKQTPTRSASQSASKRERCFFNCSLKDSRRSGGQTVL